MCVHLTFDKWRFDMFVLESPSALVNPALPIGNPRPGPVGPYRGPVGFISEAMYLDFYW
jgi:hypothetical protein